MKDYEIVIGDCLESLKKMDDCSVQSVITSPPYWGLRDYGEDGQVGLEGTPKEYVDKMVEIFREVRRVLRDDGTLWLNLGDSYISAKSDYMPTQTLAKGNKRDYIQKDSGYGYPPNRRSQQGLKSKDLVGIPWRVALALQADGWWLRQDIIWSKPNCMPESVKDRCTNSHEYIFLLTKNKKYYYDNEAIKEPIVTVANRVGGNQRDTRLTSHAGAVSSGSGGNSGINQAKKKIREQLEKGLTPMKNKRSVWTIKPMPFKGAHFAVFPEELVETCLLASTSEYGACGKCMKPYHRLIEKSGGVPSTESERGFEWNSMKGQWKTDKSTEVGGATTKTVGWGVDCECADDIKKCVVLDPFGGSGTTAVSALKHGRKAILLELNPEYAKIAEDRINNFKTEVGLDKQEVDWL